MERRRSERRRLEISVMIYKDYPVAVGRARDINRDGMYVETGLDSFTEGTVIDVECKLSRGGEHARIRFPVVVVRRSDGGMGVQFHGLGAATLQVKELLLS